MLLPLGPLSPDVPEPPVDTPELASPLLFPDFIPDFFPCLLLPDAFLLVSLEPDDMSALEDWRDWISCARRMTSSARAGSVLSLISEEGDIDCDCCD
ncbi:hypothetical protein [Noviherbaspirillum sp.]|uniref:hypothetical protein n=1 Tax=Noviherbaspirillum sp. TaxID=1926288 RepID=UPI002D7156A4|nr:hypothetical protein [Noviherbaspirillum sp.]HZW21149.1 hypothetical protein [Noviherbaspirillum sp.]